MEPPIMLTRETIDSYFTEVIATKTISPLFLHLHDNEELHFYRDTRMGSTNQKPFWQLQRLTPNLSSTSQVADVYKSILDSCGIVTEKVTHLRKAGIEYANSEGELTPEECMLMSKHANPTNSSVD
jgi:regulation of enolase protein 1 (concanavalin A-like superfamily)